ncbi:hypothetical protein, partial [Enterocloster bolteae]|uniref:hypothetical protein n=1 Tax=Enterocloster bolteae TaxID=208479 RepID=UPI002A802D71
GSRSRISKNNSGMSFPGKISLTYRTFSDMMILLYKSHCTKPGKNPLSAGDMYRMEASERQAPSVHNKEGV